MTVTFHDVLHIFFACIGTGTDIMDFKMDQDLTIIDQD